MVRCFMIRTIIVSCVSERLTLILESCLMEREIFSRGFNRKVGFGLRGEHDGHGGGKPNGNSFTLMKDAGTGKSTSSYKFYAYGSSAQKRAGYEVKSSLATDIDKAEFYAFASNRSLLLYVVGKTLYAYDYKVGYEKLYSMDLPDEVSMMKFDVKSGYGDYNDLYIATYNSTTGGTLQKYVLGTDQNKFELKPDERCCWTGLVKVKDMEWKNSAQ